MNTPIPLLECSGLSCGYSGQHVLEDVSFSVQAGETVALLGPNGSGKSTLLKCISKSIPIKSGKIKLAGQSLESLSFREAAQWVAFVPQEEQVKFEFTVREIVTMGRLPVSGSLWDTPADGHAATEAMSEADCLQFEQRSAMELSGGEKQRVLIARAIAQGASLVLFDEPTSHLDVEHQLVVARLIRRLSGSGRSTIVAIHDLNLAPMVAERAILLHEGRIGLDADTSAVLSSPLLDEAYNVKFSRSTLDSGRLAVFPESR